ncbi:MAG: hypothetical protein ABJN24_08420 [Hyphomicrobiales bacterium]
MDTPNKIKLSLSNHFIFGTMRMGDIGLDVSRALIAHMLKCGVTKFHTSFEYECYDLFCSALSQACQETNTDQATLKHIVKLASPHFDETHVSSADIVSHVERYKGDLQVDTLHCVQWMARIDLSKENERLDVLERDYDTLGDVFKKLKSSKDIEQVGCFPYTTGFAQKAIKTGLFDCMVDYLNPLETNALDYMKDLQTAGMPFTALRPFNAGKCLDEGYTIAKLLDYVKQNAPLSGAIIGTGSFEHFNEIRRLFEQ